MTDALLDADTAPQLDEEPVPALPTVAQGLAPCSPWPAGIAVIQFTVAQLLARDAQPVEEDSAC